MGNLLYIIIIIIAIYLEYFIAKQFESVAADKGYTGSKYFHMCFWLSIVGYLLVIALPDRGGNSCASATPKNGASADSQPTSEEKPIVLGETNIQCPHCGRVQFKGNKVCIKCGASLTDTNC